MKFISVSKISPTGYINMDIDVLVKKNRILNQNTYEMKRIIKINVVTNDSGIFAC